MDAFESLRESLPDPARDVKLNLQTLLEGTGLSPARRLGVAVAAAGAGVTKVAVRLGHVPALV